MAIRPETVAPFLTGPLLRRVKWTWVGYGVATYVGLKAMKRFGLMPNVADKGIRLIERGVRFAR